MQGCAKGVVETGAHPHAVSSARLGAAIRLRYKWSKNGGVGLLARPSTCRISHHLLRATASLASAPEIPILICGLPSGALASRGDLSSMREARDNGLVRVKGKG